jgi:hypothetical protein
MIGTTQDKAKDLSSTAGGSHGSALGKAAAVIGVIAFVGVSAAVLHWYSTNKRKPVRNLCKVNAGK